MELQVIDNFLPEYQFNSLRELLTGAWFPWYYTDHSSQIGDGHGRYLHSVYNTGTGQITDYLPYFDNCQQKLGVKKLYRILVNSFKPSFLFRQNTGFHTDDIPCPYTSLTPACCCPNPPLPANPPNAFVAACPPNPFCNSDNIDWPFA